MNRPLTVSFSEDPLQVLSVEITVRLSIRLYLQLADQLQFSAAVLSSLSLDFPCKVISEGHSVQSHFEDRLLPRSHLFLD